jgi:hypothetical protein
MTPPVSRGPVSQAEMTPPVSRVPVSQADRPRLSLTALNARRLVFTEPRSQPESLQPPSDGMTLPPDSPLLPSMEPPDSPAMREPRFSLGSSAHSLDRVDRRVAASFAPPPLSDAERRDMFLLIGVPESEDWDDETADPRCYGNQERYQEEEDDPEIYEHGKGPFARQLRWRDRKARWMQKRHEVLLEEARLKMRQRREDALCRQDPGYARLTEEQQRRSDAAIGISPAIRVAIGRPLSASWDSELDNSPHLPGNQEHPLAPPAFMSREEALYRRRKQDFSAFYASMLHRDHFPGGQALPPLAQPVDWPSQGEDLPRDVLDMEGWEIERYSQDEPRGDYRHYYD